MDSFDAYKVGALFSQIRSEQRPWSKADDAYRGLYDEYRRSLRIFNAVDFDDLIVLPIELFELHPEVAQSYRDTYRYVMIDEFQDTSSCSIASCGTCRRATCASWATTTSRSIPGAGPTSRISPSSSGTSRASRW